MSDIAGKWKVLSGFPDDNGESDNWEGLVEPLDSDLRRYLIHYATMVPPVGESFINEPASKNIGLPRYAMGNLFKNTGLVKGNPFKYEVTKYFYATSGFPIGVEGYNVRPARADAVLKESNWNGYENFKNAFSNQQNLRGFRITDVNDAVPTLPPAGWKEGGNIVPLIPYQEVGVGFVIESMKSHYLKPDLSYHDLMLYMHAIDELRGSEEQEPYFDISQINKYQDALTDEYPTPIAWLNIKYKGMVQQEDGTYILDDHEPDDDEMF